MGHKHGAANAAKRLQREQHGNHNPNWKGDGASYNAIHMWVRRNFAKTGVCEECGINGRTQWHNVDKTYRRIRGDWREVCRSRHCKIDGLVRNITRNA